MAGRLNGSAISAVNWSEVLQKRIRYELAPDVFVQAPTGMGVEILPFTEDDAATAAALWRKAPKAGLSLADRACLALAMRLEVPALTADRAWSGLNLGVRVQLLR